MTRREELREWARRRAQAFQEGKFHSQMHFGSGDPKKVPKPKKGKR